MNVFAQTDSIISNSTAYKRIAGNMDLSIGKIRGFCMGDSLTTILHSEKDILEAQGNDFLYYRVLCDSTLSAEISYTFNEKGLLISIGIEFFELCKNNVSENLSNEFLINLQRYYTNCVHENANMFQCISAKDLHIDYQKQKNGMSSVHTQIEFY